MLGAGRNQLAIAAQAAAMGGNVRVGLEDSLWAGPGKLATSNAEQVRAARQIIEGLGLQRRDARRGARNPRAEGRRQGRVLTESRSCCASRGSPKIESRELGEGPLWDVAEQRLYWIDSLGAKVHSCDAAGGSPRTWGVPEHIGSMALRRSGGAVVSLRDGFYTLDFCDRRLPQARRSRSRQAAHPPERRQGRPAGPLRRRLHGLRGARPALLAVPARPRRLRARNSTTGIVCSNGPCWSPDGRTFYFADTYTREIWAYDYDHRYRRGLQPPRLLLLSGARAKGLPDGATVDAEGFVWSVSVYEGKLVRFAPDGRLDRIVGLPVESTTSLSFGGPKLDVAYVTSMARAVKGVRPKEREAGGLFAVHGLGVRGLPEPRFDG